MKLTTIVPKMGDPKEYIGKPFYDEKGIQQGYIYDCQERFNGFEIFIESWMEPVDVMPPKVSFEISGK